ncbi:MAG: tetratricopeptide repeat protein [Gammaproteobacteria bacterium]|jgi:TolB-like protein|nr:tetratricopeptide repeat protein [Gammaproteobacteria bacterium]
MSRHGLWSELKRRNVVRVALFYIVAAWVVVQVAETLLPVFNVPDAAIRVIVLVLALGFPITLVFAWAFELTPEGLKRDRDANVDPATKQQTAQKLNWATLIAAVLAIGLLVADRLVPEPALTANSTNVVAVAGGSEDATADPDPASIAVLPFEDLSPSGDQGYFSDGIAEEILNVLVRIDGLEVASRTSAFRFRDRDDIGIPGIARELEVRHVLEGSVRKAGDAIRVTAQLIDGQSDKHLWSDTYDRSLTAENVFAIQDEIATAIVAALRESITLPVSARPESSMQTESLDAYELFLEARALYNQRKSLDRADALLERAVELDPEFAGAWAIRAAIYMLNSEYGFIDVTRDIAVQQVQAFSENALTTDPDNALALSVQAFNQQIEARDGRAEHDIQTIIDDLKRALALDPKNGSTRNWLGISYGETGEIELALAQFTRCVEDDPFYSPCVENAYDSLAVLGRMDEALAAYRRALESGTVTEQWVNFALLAHFDMELHFLFATNLPFYLPGWTRHDELWDAWQNLDANHDALVQDILAFIDGRDDLDKLSGGPAHLIVPLGGGYDQVPLSVLIWGPVYARYRGSEAFKARVRALRIDDYWRRNGFPPQCRSIVMANGEDDFECD